MDYLLKNYSDVDWITGVLIGCIAIITLVKILYPLRFQEFIRLPITNKYFFIYGKNDGIYHPFNVLLLLVQIALAGLVLLLIFKWKNPSITHNNVFIFIQICLGLAIFIICKVLVEISVGIIFKIPSITNRYIYQKLSYRNLMAILYMITVIILIYITPLSTFIFYLIVGTVAILNSIALFSSYKEHRSVILPNFFYFILYLCALEISPYIIIYKVLL